MLSNAFKKHLLQKMKGITYVETECDIWMDKAKLAKRLFDKTGYSKKLQLQFFDVPNVIDFSDKSCRFFNELANTKNLRLFNKNSVIIILNKAWKELQYIYVLFLFVPYLLLLASFSFFSNVITVDLDQQIFFKSKES